MILLHIRLTVLCTGNLLSLKMETPLTREDQVRLPNPMWVLSIFNLENSCTGSMSSTAEKIIIIHAKNAD